MIRPKIKLQVLPNTSVDVKNPITLDNTTLYNANLINARGNLNGNAATATVLQIARTINGVSFDGSANIIINAVDSTSRIAVSEKGVANGVATLGDNGLISATQLPSYIDDVLEFNNLSMFPVVGEIGKIYVALDTNKTYRWSGSVYIFITSGAVDSVAGKTGIVALNKNDVGLGSVDNTSDLAKPISIVTQTALNNKANILSPVFLGNVTGLGVSTGTSFNGITGLSDTAGLAAGIASAGTSTLVARADHTHPAQTSITGNAATVTTNANLTGVITSVGNATSVASQTGTGSTFVMNTSPTLVTPNIGVATGTSLNLGSGTITSGLINGQTISNSANFTGTVAVTTSLSSPLINTASGDLTIDPAGNLVVRGSTSDATTAALNVQNLAGTSLLFARNDGNVGIGTTSPSARLHTLIGNVGTINDTNINSNAVVPAVFSSTDPGTVSAGQGTLLSIEGVKDRGAVSLGAIFHSTNKDAVDFIINTGQFIASGGGGQLERLRITMTGNVGIGTINPTATVHLKAGTATAGTAPLKFISGTLLTSPEVGVFEYNNTLHFTNSDAVRRNVVVSDQSYTAGAVAVGGRVRMRIGGTEYNVLVE